MSGKAVAPWTDEIELTVKAAWSEGRSASQCSADIYAKHGVTITRNGVIGKVYRRGWKTPTPRAGGRGYVNPVPLQVRKENRKALNRITKRKSRELRLRQRSVVTDNERPWQMLRSAPSPRRYATVAPESRNLGILDLAFGDCRYATSPHESRSHLFCGAPRMEESSYCVHHHSVCHGRSA